MRLQQFAAMVSDAMFKKIAQRCFGKFEDSIRYLENAAVQANRVPLITTI